MKAKKCPNCDSTDLLESKILHVLLEQGFVMVGDQKGIEGYPTICKNCGLTMMFAIKTSIHD